MLSASRFPSGDHRPSNTLKRRQQPITGNILKIFTDCVSPSADDLERSRRNGATTRNQRLAAIKTFFHFLAFNVPELLHLNETIQAIRQKQTLRVVRE